MSVREDWFDQRSLHTAIANTQQQLAQLVATVADLTAAVKVQDAHRHDLERRVYGIEHDDANQRDRQVALGEQRALSLHVAAFAAGISLLTSLVLLAVTHISWH